MENIHNYYEKAVFEYLNSVPDVISDFSQEKLSDVICIALNKLPARYFSYPPEHNFFTSIEEMETVMRRVRLAVDNAIAKVRSEPRKH